MKIVLFGAGKIGKYCIDYKDYDVAAVIDNNPAMHGKFLCGKPIISLEEYKTKYSDCKIIISALKANEISEQLIKNNIANFSFTSKIFEDDDVPHDTEISSDNWVHYLAKHFDKPEMSILEIGSRNLTNAMPRNHFHHAAYTGFDYYPGENVDVVGDAHELSSYFNEQFDLIFSSAVFEHLAMPWKVAIEIIKLLKPGGYIFIETHYSYSSHERPWHFFQFSENALDVLFPEKFGMQCIKKGCDNLLEGKFSDAASESLQGQFVPGLYCHSEYLGRKIKELDSADLDWTKVSLQDVCMGTTYPKK